MKTMVLVKTINLLLSTNMFLLSVTGCVNIDNAQTKNSFEPSPSAVEESSIPLDDEQEETCLIRYVDECIQKLIEATDYKEASIEERRKMANKLLSQLESESAIKQFSYNKESYLFSFEYIDDSLGGIRIKDFDSTFN